MSSNDAERERRPSGANPSNADEMKKFKENLLQSDTSINEKSVLSRAPDNAPLPRHVIERLDQDKLRELKEAFLLFDLNGDGVIDLGDLRGTLVSLGESVDEAQVKSMMAEAPKPLDMEGFVTFLGCQSLDLDTETDLVKAMSRWDRDGSGLISEKKIRHDLMTWGDRFTAREVDYALEEAPLVERGASDMIDYISFCRVLCALGRTR